MEPYIRPLMMGAAGAVSPTYVEDVFSTWLYTGNGSTQTITNGIDLAGKGGMVWLKERDGASSDWHSVYDTARTRSSVLSTNAGNAAAAVGSTNGLTSFNSNGFSLGSVFRSDNASGRLLASWTFRKAEKFFDVVTWTGDGADKTISHSLGSTPGVIIAKRTSGTGDWWVYHRSLSTPNENFIRLSSTLGENGSTGQNLWNVTSTSFQADTYLGLSEVGSTYVAYLFAHNAGGFGDSGNESIISCGSYVGNGSTSGPTIDLGWEPQWLLMRRVTDGNWRLIDNMRGLNMTSSPQLFPNLSNSEASFSWVVPTSTGFSLVGNSDLNPNGTTVIYIAIRRGPMKTPTDATKVFIPLALNNTANTTNTTGFPIDLQAFALRNGNANNTVFVDRLRGVSTDSTQQQYYLSSASSNAEVASGGSNMTNNWSSTTFRTASLPDGASTVYYNFRRAAGFFDIVGYTGTGSTSQSVTHSLGVKPQLIITKKRSASDSWYVYTDLIDGTLDFFYLNFSDAKGNTTGTVPTATTFNPTLTVDNGATHIAYLFASCNGVSKVGSYTGTGTTQQINCGFTNGARFVLIKRTDSTGDWYVWDSARGIVAGNDPYLLLNSTAAEVTNTDYVDTFSAGFEISSTAPAAINANGGTFIFLAVA